MRADDADHRPGAGRPDRSNAVNDTETPDDHATAFADELRAEIRRIAREEAEAAVVAAFARIEASR